MEKNEDINLVVANLIETWNELSQCLMKNPDKLIKNQFNYFQEYQNLCQDLSQFIELNDDKRFKLDEWNNNNLLIFIKKSYLLLSKHIDNLINEIVDKGNKNIARKLRFFVKQYLDAIAPTNFGNINPEVIAKIAETNGENIITGFRQLLEDIQRGKGQLTIKMTDLEIFKLGENIACTPGKIVYQNDLMQLIQYSATTDKIYQYPLLIIPPWINKYYILDLQQENSLVKWLVDQGYTVFMISWVNPTVRHKDKEFYDYMLEGPLSALEIIKKITGEKQANILGYCIGGTLLGCLLSYLTEKKDSSIRSATFLTTLLDFSDPGELGVFIDEKQIDILEKHMESKGYLDGRIMASVFNALRANDLIWTSFVNNYLKGQKPRPFDLLYWNSDSTNIPNKVHSFYLRNMYLNNYLAQPNKIKIANISLDLRKITHPCYFLAAQDDHIVPWKTAYKSTQIINASVKFVLTSSGHVAGVVNPPQKKKYGYWVSPNTPKNSNDFLSNATFYQGSWWNDWRKWLKKYSGKLQSVNNLNLNIIKAIEDAPGSYVKYKLTDLTKD